jgi:hypothetical protein
MLERTSVTLAALSVELVASFRQLLLQMLVFQQKLRCQFLQTLQVHRIGRT